MACNIREVRHILARIQKNFECAICLELLSDPCSTKCNHQFCRSCITRVTSAQTSVCPLCKKPISRRSLNENTSLSSIVDAIKELVQAVKDDTGAICTPPLRVSSQLSGTPGIRAFSLAHPTPKKCKPQVSSDSSEDEQQETQTKSVSSSRIKAAIQRRSKKNVRQTPKPPTAQPTRPQCSPLALAASTSQPNALLSNTRRTPAAKKPSTKTWKTASIAREDTVPAPSVPGPVLCAKPHVQPPTTTTDSLVVIEATGSSEADSTTSNHVNTCSSKQAGNALDGFPCSVLSKGFKSLTDVDKPSVPDSPQTIPSNTTTHSDNSLRQTANVSHEYPPTFSPQVTQLSTDKQIAPPHPSETGIQGHSTPKEPSRPSLTELSIEGSITEGSITKQHGAPPRISQAQPSMSSSRESSYTSCRSIHQTSVSSGQCVMPQHVGTSRRKGSLRSVRLLAKERKQTIVQKQDELAYLLEHNDASPRTVSRLIKSIDEDIGLLECPTDGLCNEQNDLCETSETEKPDSHLNETIATTSAGNEEQQQEKVNSSQMTQAEVEDTECHPQLPQCSTSTRLPCDIELPDGNETQTTFKAMTDNMREVAVSEAQNGMHSGTDASLGIGVSLDHSYVMKAHGSVDESIPKSLILEGCANTSSVCLVENDEVLASPRASDSPCNVIDPMAHIEMLRNGHFDSEATICCDTSTAGSAMSTSFSTQSVSNPCSPIAKDVMSSLTSSTPRNPSDEFLFAKPTSTCGHCFGGRKRPRRCRDVEEDSVADETAVEFTIAAIQSDDMTDDFIPQTPPICRPSSAPDIPLYSIFSPLIVSPRSASVPLVGAVGGSPFLHSPKRRVLCQGLGSKQPRQIEKRTFDHVNVVDVSNLDSEVISSSQPSPSIISHQTANNQSITQNSPNNHSMDRLEVDVDRRLSPAPTEPPTSSRSETERLHLSNSVMASTNCDHDETQVVDFLCSDGPNGDKNKHATHSRVFMSSSGNYKETHAGCGLSVEGTANYGNKRKKRLSASAVAAAAALSVAENCEDEETLGILPLSSAGHDKDVLAEDTQFVEILETRNVQTVGESEEDVNNSISSLPMETRDTQRDCPPTSLANIIPKHSILGPSSVKRDEGVVTPVVSLVSQTERNCGDSTNCSQSHLNQELGSRQANSSQSELTSTAGSQELDVMEVERELDRRTRELAEVKALLGEEPTECQRISCQTTTMTQVKSQPVTQVDLTSPPSSPSLSPSPPPGPPLLPVSDILCSISLPTRSRSQSVEPINNLQPGSSSGTDGDPSVEESQSIFGGLRAKSAVSLEPPSKKVNKGMGGFDETCFGANVVIPSVSVGSQLKERVAVREKEKGRGCEKNGRLLSFLTSGLTRNQTAKVKELATKYGGRLARCFNRNTSHVICKTGENRVASRTMKFLLGVAGGKWIVDYHWAEECLKQHCLVSEEDYEVAGDTGSRQRGGPKAARLKETKEDKRLLSGQIIALLGEFVAVPRDHLCQLLDVAGAEVIESEKATSDFCEGEGKQVTVVCDPERSALKGHWLDVQGPVTAYWVTDSIAAHKILPLSQYLVGVETCSYLNSDIMDSPSLVPDSPDFSTREP